VLWMTWVTQWLLNSIYIVLTFVTFTKLWEASSAYLPGTDNFWNQKSWRAPMASCMLGGLLVIGFDLMSCVTLIKKSINRAGPGFGFGFIVSFSFILAFFLLLCGLVLDGFRTTVQNLEAYDWSNPTGLANNQTANPSGFKWSKYDSQTFVGAEVFALLNFCTFLMFGAALCILQAGVSEQLGIVDNRYAQLDAAPVITVPTALQSADAAAAADGQYAQHEYGYDANQQYAGTSDKDAAGYYGTADTAGYYANTGYQQAQGATADDNANYYNTTEWQGYNQETSGSVTAPAGATGAGLGYYGHAAYGATAVTSDYTYNTEQGTTGYAEGSGLLGGQTFGTAAGSTTAQGFAPATYKQQL